MTRMMTGSANDLIDRSVSYGEIVHAEWTEGRAADLLADSDGYAEDGDVIEYWGTIPADDDTESEVTEPQAWRVHLHRTEAE